MAAVWPVKRIVGAGVEHQLLEHVAGHRIERVPVRALERRQVEDLAVGREGDAIGAAFVIAHPDSVAGRQIERAEAPVCGDVDAAGASVRRDALHVLWIQPGRDVERRGPPDEAVALVHVVDDQPDPAVFDVVADTRCGDIKKVLIAPSGNRGRRPGQCDDRCSAAPCDDSELSPRHSFPRLRLAALIERS